MWWRAWTATSLPLQQQRTAAAAPESGADEFRRGSGRPLPLSVGIAESSLQVGEGLQQLLTQADAAMYANKSARH